jgi:hypothetical protein
MQASLWADPPCWSPFFFSSGQWLSAALPESVHPRIGSSARHDRAGSARSANGASRRRHSKHVPLRPRDGGHQIARRRPVGSASKAFRAALWRRRGVKALPPLTYPPASARYGCDYFSASSPSIEVVCSACQPQSRYCASGCRASFVASLPEARRTYKTEHVIRR